MVYPEFFWIPEKLGVKNGGKSSPSENPNFLKIPEIVGVTPSFSIVGLFLFGDFKNEFNSIFTMHDIKIRAKWKTYAYLFSIKPICFRVILIGSIAQWFEHSSRKRLEIKRSQVRATIKARYFREKKIKVKEKILHPDSQSSGMNYP